MKRRRSYSPKRPLRRIHPPVVHTLCAVCWRSARGFQFWLDRIGGRRHDACSMACLDAIAIRHKGNMPMKPTRQEEHGLLAAAKAITFEVEKRKLGLMLKPKDAVALAATSVKAFCDTMAKQDEAP